ncbi:hypothetical protein D3C73_837530 [compost metagenome]
MSSSHLARLNACNFQIYNITTIQRNNPTDGTNEFEIVITPAHVFREIHSMQNTKQTFSQNLRSFNTCCAFAHIDVFGTAYILESKLLWASSLTACKSKRSFAPFTFLIKSDFTGRTLHFFMNVLLLLSNILDEHSKTTWCSITFYSPMLNDRILKPFLYTFFQLLHSCANKTGRHFFQANFK